MTQWLNQEIVPGNETWRLLALGAAAGSGLLVGWILKLVFYFLSRRVNQNEGRPVVAALFSGIAKAAGLLVLTVGLSIGAKFLVVPERVEELIGDLIAVLGTIAISAALYHMVGVANAFMTRQQSEDNQTKLDSMAAELVRKILKVVIVLGALIQIVTILSDQEVTSIIAGLGIGGLAVALAAQDSIKHFFGSIVLSGDKPFRLGERVVVDGHDGPIEKVGLRSTHLRTLEGHLVVIPNGELANKTIRNIGRRPYIRRVMNVTITYDTPPEKVERAVAILKELLDNHEGMNKDFPPRVYFNDFGSTSLDILVIYWYHPPDYWAFMDFSEKLNHQLLRRFNEEGIDFAFPTQTLYLAGDANRPLNVGIQDIRPEPGQDPHEARS